MKEKNSTNYTDIDVAVCYHKKSMLFESDAIHPMQLNKKLSNIDLGFRGDDLGINISEKNKFYSEDTALYQLWKNSKSKVKGCLHYRRLLDLNKPGKKNYSIVMTEIKESKEFVQNLGLTSSKINELLKTTDILIRNKTNVKDFFDGSIEEQFKAIHIHHHWDLAMEIVEKDFPEIYPIAKDVSKGCTNYFHNCFIMKSKLFDALCKFCFSITEKLEKQIDEDRLEFNDGWRYTARYLSFVFERMAGIFITYLQKKGYKVSEFPGVSIVPKNNQDIESIKNYMMDAYTNDENSNEIVPTFKNNIVPIVMSTDDNYACCCAAIIQSIKENSNSCKNYEINILTQKLSSFNKTLLENMSCSNINIRVIYANKYIEKYNITSSQINQYFSLEAYLRMFIPEIFKTYSKVLYLDVDMIVLRDIAELYDTDIGNNWWGVVQDKFFVTECHTPQNVPMKQYTRKYIKSTLKMTNIADIFNSGVMIWNIDQCKKDHVLNQCIAKLLKIKKPRFVDQCILNAVANGKHIFWLSPYWNVSWNVDLHWNDGFGSEAYNTALHYRNNPYIIHYTGSIKPWNEPWRDYSEYFWKYVRKTPYYEKLLTKVMFNITLYEIANNKNNVSLKKIKRKIKKYLILKILTLGLIKTINERYKKYKNKLKS